MTDRPHTFTVRSSDDRRLAAALVTQPAVSGVALEDAFEIERSLPIDRIERGLVVVVSAGTSLGMMSFAFAGVQPDLFARICGYFERAGFNIAEAKVHTTRNGYALDTFLVVSPYLEPQARDDSAAAAASVSTMGSPGSRSTDPRRRTR